MGRVEGTVVFVTGAARGQGRAHALRPAEAGADIVAADLCDQVASVPYAMANNVDALAETVQRVEALDRRIVAREADARDTQARHAALAAGEVEVGPVDVQVADHGIVSTEPSDTPARQAWQDMTDTTLAGVGNACQGLPAPAHHTPAGMASSG